MLTENEVMVIFRKKKKEIIKLLGRKATTDIQLTSLGHDMFGKKYTGTYSQDHKPKKLPKCQYFIINTDRRGGNGTHWVAIVKNNNTFYIYDSFARNAKRLIPVFSKGKLIIESDLSDAEQRGDSEVCGQLCLSFLYVVNKHGIRAALLI
jgi:hypothetical protein